MKIKIVALVYMTVFFGLNPVYAGSLSDVVERVMKVNALTKLGREIREMSEVAEKIWREDLSKELTELETKQRDHYLKDVRDLLAMHFNDLNLIHIVKDYLSNPGEHCLLAPEDAAPKHSIKLRKVFFAHQREKINQFLLHFIELLPVSKQDVAYVNQMYENEYQKRRYARSGFLGFKPPLTREAFEADVPRNEFSLITQEMNAFKAARTKTPVGLYKAVFGKYPDLTQCYRASVNGFFVWKFSEAEAQEKYREWDQNPMLPLTCTTTAEDRLLAKRIRMITGRKISIMSAERNEYMRRGRELVRYAFYRKPTGSINMSSYFFGETKTSRKSKFQESYSGELEAHAVMRWHTPRIAVNQAPKGHSIDHFTNNFGIIHSIGLVWERDLNGIRLGGSESSQGLGMRSSPGWEMIDDGNVRRDDTGFRLAEEIEERHSSSSSSKDEVKYDDASSQAMF